MLPISSAGRPLTPELVSAPHDVKVHILTVGKQ